MVWEHMSTLFGNLSLFGIGSGIIMIGLIVGLTRGLTDNNKQWLMIFPAIAMFLAFAIPSSEFSNIMFVSGAIAISFLYWRLEYQGRNSMEGKVTAIIALWITISILMLAHNTVNPQSMSESVIYNEMLDFTNQNNPYTTDDLCVPGDETCTNKVLTDNQDTSLFDPFFSGLQIFTWIGKLVTLLGYLAFGPLIFTDKIASLVNNNIIQSLLLMGGLIWNISNIFVIYNMVTNKRGE